MEVEKLLEVVNQTKEQVLLNIVKQEGFTSSLTYTEIGGIELELTASKKGFTITITETEEEVSYQGLTLEECFSFI